MSGQRDRIRISRALLSVSDKRGLVDLGRALAEAGVVLVSTGSTAAVLVGAGLPVTEVAEVTGFPESLDGRVKTLHPAIHAGLLADLNRPEHAEQLGQLGIEPFELVVSSLYPFERTAASGADDAAIIEQIDIGGPALVRAAAKNHANVAVVTSVAQFDGIVAALADGGTTLEQRRALAAAAFGRIADYDRAIAEWFLAEPDAPDVVEGEFRFAVAPLRYGENAHQSASLWRDPSGRGLAQAEQLHGREMSYNNYVDADAAVRAVLDFDEPAVAVVKHANPCGIAVAPPRAPDAIAAAHRRANDCDPVSAFGGVIAANRTVTLGMAEAVAQIFTEVVVAPDFEPAALTVLSAKKNIRLLRLPAGFTQPATEFRQVSGGVLVQEPDRFAALDPSSWRQVTGAPVDEETLADLVFAWKACRSVKSNAILLADRGAAVGIGMGQVNRVDSCHLAVTRAGSRAAGSVAASDAYFPFADGAQVLLDAGVRAIVQPGGSVRDAEVIAAVEAAGVPMLLTGERHFFH
ncbi:bifunctional phosphoribosylaminoimidazolecarboxamide formyltransferase/IMP cyclohydrolase [Amnibacterium sp.]|uniref:bifunctional phosphoribosylaminoimidazolecarboxamide formyltransferase/IMP cyclohydrolase n=1 Tax=Amnibacterium sp. TaxID=1872496 RepID=UPI002638B67A|nr:bifunctional phosphoribosylaminoimidazolecarboxamide formyltransferase/IMP cyclohydrolase [Amnibacterium sp.]MCU1474742.1 purH [Amnibacterium sp.]